MIQYFPKQISERAIVVYLISLATITVVYYNYAMGIGYVALGCLWVIGFFLLLDRSSKEWGSYSEKRFVNSLWWSAFALRLVWVIASYYFYDAVTGQPFEFQARDSMGYHLDAEWLAGERWSVTWDYLFGGLLLADSGYPFYLTVIYKIFGPVVIIPRLINVLLSSWTCILIYRIASRTFGDDIGRIAGLMAVLMPNLIIYCGYHLKETLMIFLEIACLERADAMIRNKRLTLWGVVIPSLLAASLFLFRTALGAAAIFSIASAVLISSAPAMKRSGKRMALVGWGILALVVFGGGAIASEVESLWEGRGDNLTNKRAQQTIRGNQWAQYATSSVMAPMITVLPFATMIDVDEQYGQQAKSGGNYIRNFMGFFVFLAFIESIRRRQWRNFVLIGAFVVSYLGVVALSGFNNSERFLLPGLPGLIMMWAYGLSVLRPKTYKYLLPWCVIVFVMEFAWAFFKLGSRGIL